MELKNTLKPDHISFQLIVLPALIVLNNKLVSRLETTKRQEVLSGHVGAHSIQQEDYSLAKRWIWKTRLETFNTLWLLLAFRLDSFASAWDSLTSPESENTGSRILKRSKLERLKISTMIAWMKLALELIILASPSHQVVM